MKNESSFVYVVTRNKRRIEDKNYSYKSDAEFRLEQLKKSLKIYDPLDIKNIDIVKTKKPNQIR